MWSLIDEVTTGKQRLVLVIIKLTPIMWSSSSINTQCFGHLKSSSNLQLINGKSRDLQKLLKYFNGTISSVLVTVLVVDLVVMVDFHAHLDLLNLVV